ncbi:MAG: 50S ribosomal protein L28 [Candidatus Moranbacteria bacterium]|nr:50S ribosomal protein L28 [Candidatus Moranbacteria bacterium]
MAKVCSICGRNYHKANIINKLRGKYNRAGIKKQRINLKWKVVDGKRVRICTRCIKTKTRP